MASIVISGKHRLLPFFHLPNFNSVWQFEFFVNPGPYGAGNFKTPLLLLFHPISAKLYEDIGYHGGIKAVGFLGN